MKQSLVEMPKVSKDSLMQGKGKNKHITQCLVNQGYQALCYMLISALFGKEYDVRMEQDAGHGRSDIMAHPLSSQRSLALIFEIKPHLNKNGRRSLKTAKRIEKDLENSKTEALAQLADRRYRERVPLHAKKVHEFALVFCGNFCVASVRTLKRDVTEDWNKLLQIPPLSLNLWLMQT
jgi:hypothetical protein